MKFHTIGLGNGNRKVSVLNFHHIEWIPKAELTNDGFGLRNGVWELIKETSDR